MPRHAETRVLPYTPEQLFDLVADVPRYTEFLPWVVAVRVRSDSETEMVADLAVGFKALRERFTSRVKKARPERITVDYLDGPLDHLTNEWDFRAHPNGCELHFVVDFAFKSRIFEAVAGQVFGTALRKMIGAFETRAAQLYAAGAASGEGSPSGGSSRSSAHSAA